MLRTRGEDANHPALLLLGPRGSGKSTLTGHLERWAKRAPLAVLDLAPLAGGDHTGIDVLARIAFQLNARKPGFPALPLPSFTVLMLAIATTTDQNSRENALNQMREALQAGRAEEHSFAVLRGLMEAAGAVLGLPGWAMAALPLLQGWERGRVWLRAHRRLSHAVRHTNTDQDATEFLVQLNHQFNHGGSPQRERAEEVLLRAFLADLRGAYTNRRGDRLRTVRCLVLLDNVDCDVGDAFLRSLLEARRGPGHNDPLVVVAASRGRTGLLRQLEQGRPPAGTYLPCWRQDSSDPLKDRFTPLLVQRHNSGRLAVAQLRPLDRGEVEDQAGTLLAAALPAETVAGIERPVRWLGWIVYELTRGHPLATGVVLDALEGFGREVSCAARLRRALAPETGEPVPDRQESVAAELLRQLLRDESVELRARLPQAAAAVTLGQAEAADGLWQVADTQRRRVGELADDDLRTVRVDVDGRQRAALPDILRRLLLDRLALAVADAAEPGWWGGAHDALRDATGAGREAAYHQLARGDLSGAVGHLQQRFGDLERGDIPAEVWCAELSWIQRAPRRWDPGTLACTARSEYQRLVGVARGGVRQRAVTRLLAAGWITAHPPSDPYAHLWSDPLGDPYAELYPDIAEELLELRSLLNDEHNRHVFLRRADEYRRKPW